MTNTPSTNIKVKLTNKPNDIKVKLTNKPNDIEAKLTNKSNDIEAKLTNKSKLNVKLNTEDNLSCSASIGIKGPKGEDGYTPIKGVDYFTQEDIDSLKDIFSQLDHTHTNKIDDVRLEDNVLNFYADGELITSVELPTRSKAICGEFLCGELTVGEGIEKSLRTESPKWIDGVTPVNAQNMNEIEDKLKAHQEALNELLYVPLTINLTSNKPTTIEKGTIIDSVIFSWSYNKDITSQKFNNQALEVSVRSFAYNTPFNTNKSFKLEANDGKGDFSKSISFNFLNGRYWGVSNASTYDSDFIKSLSKELSSSRNKTFTVNCGEGQHIFYCVPTSFGNCSFKVGGFEGGFNKVNTIQFTNASGYTENYDIYKSTNSNLGNTTVVVS